MENFKIEEIKGRFYVIPTANYLNSQIQVSLPYDTNFLIYKLFGYEPKEFLQYLCEKAKARVEILKEFPYVDFSFSTYILASQFLEELNKRSTVVQENLL